MTTRLALIAAVLAASFCVAAEVQTYKAFPGEAMNRRTLDTQQRVERLYAAGNYERSLFIYEHELAPLGDKYAQYMVGFMNLNGHGTPPSKIRALAWYRIAAERGEPVLLIARDELSTAMTPDEVTTSNSIFLELWQSIGDTKLIMNLIRRDLNILSSRTGSRIAQSVSSSPALIYRPTGQLVPPNYYRDVRVQLEARLNYLETRVEVLDVNAGLQDEALQLLEEQVRAELAALQVP